jgi:hypothetical protein
MNSLKQEQIKILKRISCKDLADKVNEIVEWINDKTPNDDKKLEKSVIQTIPAKTLEWGLISPTEMNWEDAKKWCEEQGGRMPTKLELLHAYEDRIDGFKEDNYWSATEYNSTVAYFVNFTYGFAIYAVKTNAYYVRCVRR